MALRPFILNLVLAVAAFSQVPAIEPGVSHELAKWRAARYSDVRYTLDLTLEKMSPVLKGSMEIRVNVKSSPPYEGGVDAALGGRGGSLLILDWRKIKGYEDRSTISNVSLNGKLADVLSPQAAIADKGVRVPFEELNEHLIFRDGVVLGENVIKLDFTSPILASGSAITRYIDKEDGAEYIYSLFVPSDASTAFPVFDQPDLKAKFTTCASLPNEWKFVSNEPAAGGWEIDGTSGQKKSFCIDNETKPISTYVFAFAAGPFERVSEPPAVAGGLTRNPSNSIEPKTPLVSPSSPSTNLQPPATAGGSDIYVRKSQTEKFKPHAAEVFRLNREGIKFLEQYFDYKFPFPKYDLVLIPEFPFGGMEHAGATFLRESAIIFPQEPTRGDHISRANLIFHEAAHQWFGDTVTMNWFDDLWLKEGFAEFMAYKTLERVMPEANSWKVFYERNKQAAYATDSTKGTTPIYQPIANLNSAKSAYGNIVYRKAPSFLRQAEFYIGPDKFQTAVRALLKKHEYANAGWEDLVKEFEGANPNVDPKEITRFADIWVTKRGLKTISTSVSVDKKSKWTPYELNRGSTSVFPDLETLPMRFKCLVIYEDGSRSVENVNLISGLSSIIPIFPLKKKPVLVLPNYQDYGYGIFLLDDKSRDYVLKNIHNEKDPFLRSMMWGSLWDSVREGELDPKGYISVVIKNLPTETDEMIISTVLGRATTALNYYVPDKTRETLLPQFENVLIERLTRAETLGQRINIYRSLLNVATTTNGRDVLRAILRASLDPKGNVGSKSFDPGLYSIKDVERILRFEEMLRKLPLKTKDKFDIVTRLAVLGDPDAPRLLTELEKTETSDDAKRYAYAARAGFAGAENKAKYWNDFVNNKEISESWIEAAFGPWNSIRHNELTLPYLQKALQELPNHKRNRKIFFVNGWLAAFIGGQRSEEALAIVNKFLADNPSLDNDLRLKILENVDLIERAVRIRAKHGRN